jgi:hypothetical protein
VRADTACLKHEPDSLQNFLVKKVESIFYICVQRSVTTGKICLLFGGGTLSPALMGDTPLTPSVMIGEYSFGAISKTSPTIHLTFSTTTKLPRQSGDYSFSFL